MKTLARRFAHVFVFCTFGFTACAQTANPVSPAAPPKLPLHLNVVVTPSSGTPVPDLPQSVFTLFDNGKPQPIQSFRAVSGKVEPVKVMIVVDAINLNFTRLAYERSQLDAFFHANGGKLLQPTSLIILTDTTTESTGGFTTDGTGLSQTLDNKDTGLRELRRGSGFYGAEDRLDLSLNALHNVIAYAATVPGRKAIVWISPGWPLLSGPEVQLTAKQSNGIFREIMYYSAQLRAANVTLYSVDPLGAAENPAYTFYYEEFLKGVKKPSQVFPGDLGLQVLAIQSGGLALSSSNDVNALLQRCVDDTRAFYEISYMPPPAEAPNEYHHIEVKVAEPHLIARAKQGYYSQPAGFMSAP